MRLDKYRPNRRGNEEEESWAPISDFMAGLMMVFLLIAISFMVDLDEQSGGAIQTNITVSEILGAYKKNKVEIYDDLVIAFKDDMKEWNMKIDEVDGTIRFEEPEVLFDEGKDTVKPKFKEILDQFFPKYIDTIYKNHRGSIKEIRIEGHTSSEWAEETTKQEAFSNNMELSQDRTRNVLDYILRLPEVKDKEEWLRKHVTANGMSSSRIILKDGVEDKNESRRVEFRIITDAEDIIAELMKNLEKQEGKKND